MRENVPIFWDLTYGILGNVDKILFSRLGRDRVFVAIVILMRRYLRFQSLPMSGAARWRKCADLRSCERLKLASHLTASMLNSKLYKYVEESPGFGEFTYTLLHIILIAILPRDEKAIQ